jgi:hypothetical protein
LKYPKIFLSTDNPEVEKLFQKTFSDIITLPKELPIYSENNMGTHQYAIRTGNYEAVDAMFKQSVMDMWLLASCEFLIYQNNSSFSKISAILKPDKTKISSW